MPAPIRVLFAADGAQTVSAVFKSLKREAQELATAQTRAARTLTREQSRAANDTARAAQKSAKEAERIEANKARIRERSATMAGRVAKQQADAEIREAQRAAKAVERIRENSARMAGRIADQQARQEARAAQRAQASAAARQRGLARGASQMVSRATRGTIGTVTGVAGAMGLAGGGMLIGSAMMGGLDLQRQAALLSNATSMPGAAGKSPNELLGLATGTATRTGFKAEDVMGAMSVVSARAGGASGLNALAGDLDDVAKTALAAGVSMEDMGATYAAALNAGVKPGAEMRQLMIDFVEMGKKGAVEFSDLASELAKLAGAGRAFGSGSGMLRQVVGLAQLAVQTDVSPEEARTTVIDMVREFTQGPKMAKLKKAGVDVENAKTGRLNDPAMLLAGAIDAANTRGIGGEKGLAGLSEIFSGKSAGLARLLNETYLAAESKTKGAGKQAVLDQIAGASATSMTLGQRDSEYNAVAGTAAQKTAVAMEQFNAKIRELIPRFTELLPAALKAVEGLAKLADYAANNPFKALGAVFAAHLTKELAVAGIGKALETGINAALASAGGRNAAAFGSIAIAATAVYLTGTKIIDEIDKSAKQSGADEFANVAGAGNLLRTSGGTATPEQAAEAAKLAEGLKINLAQRESRETLWTKKLAPLAAMPVLAPMVGLAMGGEKAYDTFTANSAAAGGGGQSKADVEAMLAAMITLAGSAKKAADELNKVQGGSVANTNNQARYAPASSMSTGH